MELLEITADGSSIGLTEFITELPRISPKSPAGCKLIINFRDLK